jgi:hypothetical protein
MRVITYNFLQTFKEYCTVVERSYGMYGTTMVHDSIWYYEVFTFKNIMQQQLVENRCRGGLDG